MSNAYITSVLSVCGRKWALLDVGGAQFPGTIALLPGGADLIAAASRTTACGGDCAAKAVDNVMNNIAAMKRCILADSIGFGGLHAQNQVLRKRRSGDVTFEMAVARRDAGYSRTPLNRALRVLTPTIPPASSNNTDAGSGVAEVGGAASN